MFTATLVAMLLANVLFAAVVARMSRRKFIPLAYGFFIFNLGLFFVLMRGSPAEGQVWIGRGLYVWVSVFNLFNTAIFWAFMTDLFTVEQGKRLYGFIAVGGSLGAIAGADISKHFVGQIGPANLLAISAVMFAVAGSLVRFFPTGFADRHEPEEAKEAPIGGSVWSGLTHIARSPYLARSGGLDVALHDHFDLGLLSAIGSGSRGLQRRGRSYYLPRQPRDLGQQHHGPDSDFSYRPVAEMVWGWNHARGDAVPEYVRLCGRPRSIQLAELEPWRRPLWNMPRACLYDVVAGGTRDACHQINTRVQSSLFAQPCLACDPRQKRPDHREK